jgi:hypothetical protein
MAHQAPEQKTGAQVELESQKRNFKENWISRGLSLVAKIFPAVRTECSLLNPRWISENSWVRGWSADFANPGDCVRGDKDSVAVAAVLRLDIGACEQARKLCCDSSADLVHP